MKGSSASRPFREASGDDTSSRVALFGLLTSEPRHDGIIISCIRHTCGVDAFACDITHYYHRALDSRFAWRYESSGGRFHLGTALMKSIRILKASLRRAPEILNGESQ